MEKGGFLLFSPPPPHPLCPPPALLTLISQPSFPPSSGFINHLSKRYLRGVGHQLDHGFCVRSAALFDCIKKSRFALGPYDHGRKSAAKREQACGCKRRLQVCSLEWLNLNKSQKENRSL